MSASQRRKGQAGEREAHRVLWEQLGDVVEPRDLSQTRDGGGDIRIPKARVLVEVKRCESLSRPKWLRQAREAARAQGDGWYPVVAWRRDASRWEPAEWRFYHGEDLEQDLPEFCDWVRGRL